jgi:PAS domain S-box-containing protein
MSVTADQFLQLADLFPEPALLVTGGGTVLAANRAARELLGTALAEIQGRPLAELAVAPGVDALSGYLQACARGRDPVPGSLTLAKKGGDQMVCRCEGALVQPPGADAEALLLLRLTPQEAALNQLRETLFRAVIEKSWDAVALLDGRGIARYASPSTARTLGYTPEELVGRNVFDLIHPDDLARTTELFGQLLHGPGVSLSARFRFRHKDGSWRWLEGAGTNLLDEPRVGAIVTNYHDITDRYQAEQEREELLARAEAVRVELERANRAKDEFIAVLAHELRNPLAPVLNALHLLRLAGADRHTAEQARAMIERQVRHLTRLVDDLLEVSRLSRGKTRLRKERLDLARLVRTTAEDRRRTVEQAGLGFTVAVPETPVWVRGDATRLAQVLGNLLENAVKFTDRGGRVSVQLAPAEEGGRRLAVLRVRDTGVGIEPELLPRLFEPFRQADQSLERAAGGLGLGLALVKGLTELHGGEVQALSPGEGRGAEFVVRLPAEEEPAALTEAPTASAPTARRLRVLIVEDNRDAADSLQMLLEFQGHEVAVAYTGPEGLRAARVGRPDIVLCDIGLPGLDGYSVAREIRRDPTAGKARLIAITGYGSDEDRRRALTAGFDHFLTKPADPAVLKQLLVRPGD